MTMRLYPGAPAPVNQLGSVTHDGMPDENARENCIPSSETWALELLGLDQGERVAPDDLKDAVYGQGYTGGTAATRYVSYLGHLGARLAPVSGAQLVLLQDLHAYAARNVPVLFTIPSLWNNPPPVDPMNPGGSHVVCLAGDEAGGLVAMNPWNGFWHEMPDSWLRPRLCYGQIWPIEKMEDGPMGIPSGWHDSAGGDPAQFAGVLTAPNGIAVVRGFRVFLLTAGWNGDNWPLAAEAPTQQVETWNPAGGANVGTRQNFRWAALGYTPARAVFRIWTGFDIAHLEAEVSANIPGAVVDLHQIQQLVQQSVTDALKQLNAS